jgi:hypothetical protein
MYTYRWAKEALVGLGSRVSRDGAVYLTLRKIPGTNGKMRRANGIRQTDERAGHTG